MNLVCLAPTSLHYFRGLTIRADKILHSVLNDRSRDFVGHFPYRMLTLETPTFRSMVTLFWAVSKSGET